MTNGVAVQAPTPVPGRIAARIDRLPLTPVQWELAILTQIAWGLIIVDTDGIAGRLYPFVWAPANVLTVVQYAVIQALEVGLGVLIGAFVMGQLSDRYGRRPAIMAAAFLAGIFVWPFAFVTNFWALVVLSILSTLGVGAIVATHAVYISEIVPPPVRNRVLLGSQSVTAVITVISGLLAFWLIPSHWQWYVYLMAISQLFILLPLLVWRLPESPRWLEAHGRQADAEKAIEVLENRCQRYTREPLPEPDSAPRPVVKAGRGAWRELFTSGLYRQRTLILLAAWFLGYAGIVYGAPSFAAVYMADHGMTAQFVFALITVSGVIRFGAFWANAQLGERVERRKVIFALSVLFSVSYIVIFLVPTAPAMAVFYTLGSIGGGLWLFNMYNYTAVSFPTRMRSMAFSWTDGLGHLGAWGGITLTGVLFLMGPNHLGWILFMVIPGALVPSLLVLIWGINQRQAILEQVST
ncbi:MAG: MFS transporter [Chloroflexi bacterium]|nr:MFS transporter [Chloroflexota bacterium]MBV9597944.1 MFS transporter [Chloroflexota bacterium]